MGSDFYKQDFLAYRAAHFILNRCSMWMSQCYVPSIFIDL
jgi:hypothetical protein